MRLGLAASFLGGIAAVLAAGMFLALAAGLLAGEGGAHAAAFLTSALIALASAGFLILSGRGASALPLSKGDLCLLAVLGWAGGAFFAALPFYLSRDLSASQAYFEALSGLTTTGASMIEAPAQSATAILFWRALLQWLGGAATLVMGLLVLVPLGAGGMELRRMPIGSGQRDSNFHRLLQAVRFVAPVYSGLTAVCFLLLWGAGASAFGALCLALSTLSTGGFDPGLAAAPPAPVLLVLALFMLLGAISIPRHREALAGDLAALRREPEARAFLFLIGAAAIVLAGYLLSSGLDPLSALFSGLFAAISLLSTTGYMPADLPALPPVPVLALALAGGTTLSTAGGIKVLRLLLLFRQSRRELSQLAHPHGVITASFGGTAIDAPLVQSVWTLLILFILSFAGLTLLLAAGGLDALPALSAAAAALANAGPILHLAQPAAPAYAELPLAALWPFCAGMIAGRVELIAFFSLFTLGFWRR